MTALLFVAAAVGAVNSLLLFRWRKRNQRDLDAAQYEMRSIHKLISAGRPIGDTDRRIAQLDVEQYMFALPNCAVMALLAIRLATDVGVPDPTGTAFRISGYVLIALAVVLFVAWCRHFLRARRLGIHPRPVWR